MANFSPSPPRISALVDDFQARGRYTFTRDEMTKASERSAVAMEASIRRLKEQHRLANPRRGFFVIVPVEYRDAGSPPASWFIDDLMQFLGQPYYVGLLTAAALHGAAHQQPMVFQVLTDRATRPARAGRVRVEFHMSRYVADDSTVNVQDVQTETGSMRVSAPETTAFDLVRFPGAAGHLNNVATVLGELAEKLDPAALVALATKRPTPDAQRLGYLLELVGEQSVAESLARALEHRRHRVVPLSPGREDLGEPPHERWKVVPNAVVEVDL